MRLYRIISIFIVSSLIYFAGIRANAATVADTWRQPFVDGSGIEIAPATLADSADSKPSTLILFWASWCAPCREELAWVVTEKERFANVSIIAINVDDEAGWNTAQVFLQRIAWPFPHLRDDGGKFFYGAHVSGELPLSLLFHRSGRLIAAFDALSIERINSEAAAAATGISDQGGFTVSGSASMVSQRTTGGDGKIGTANTVVNTATASWRRDSLLISASHNVLRQKQAGNDGNPRPEDELGFSYFEWRPLKPSEYFGPIGRLRLGDDSLALMGGALFAARYRADTNESSSLAGMHGDLITGPVTTTIVGGMVRERLYPYQLDASRDLSVSGPRESAAGLLMRFGGHSGVRASAGAIKYRSGKDVFSGIPQASEDLRVGGGLNIGSSLRGVDIQYVTYVPESDAARARGSQLQTTGRSAMGESLSLAVGLQHSRELPVRVSVPELTETPFLPLAIGNRDTLKVTPSMFLSGAGTFYLTALHDEEAAIKIGTGRNYQNTATLKWVGPVKSLEAFVGQQNGRYLTLGQRHVESAASSGGDLLQGVHLSVSGQRYRSTNDATGDEAGEGKRLRARLDADFPKIFPSNAAYRIRAGITGTKQTDYYMTTSGLTEQILSSADMAVARGSVRLRLAVGREPGGLVCTGGSCSQRAPLNGGRLEFDWERSF